MMDAKQQTFIDEIARVKAEWERSNANALKYISGPYASNPTFILPATAYNQANSSPPPLTFTPELYRKVKELLDLL